MADILFICHKCSKNLTIDDKGSGRTIKCPDCQNPIIVPRPTIFLRCSSCNSELSAPNELKGNIRNCPSCNKEVVLFSKVGAGLKSTCPECNRSCSPEDRFCVKCGSSLNSSAAPNKDRIQGKYCPCCKSHLSLDSVICINCGLNLRTGKRIETISEETAFSQTHNNGHMLFSTCPKCGDDLCAFCMNCGHFDMFRSSGMSAECSCGTSISAQYNCMHCQAPIPTNSFAPDAEKEAIHRKRLPKDGKVNKAGNFVQMFFNILLRPQDTGGKILRAVFFIALFFLLTRSPGCTEKERYWYDQGHAEASSWLQGSFGAEYETRSDASLKGIADRCSCPSEYFSNFKDGYRKALDENNELHSRLTPP